MNMRKYISIVLMILFTSITLSSCGINKESKTIIFIPKALECGEYWENINNNIKKASEDAGYNFKRMGSKEWDATKQAEVIKEAVKEKPCAIVLGPVDDAPLFEAIKEANKSNIPIILVDSDIDRELLESDDAYVTTFVGASNYDGGVQVADKIAEKLSSGDKVAILSNGADGANAEERCAGFRHEISKKGMNVVAEAATNWSIEMGYEKAKLLFDAYPDLKAVFAVNGPVYDGMQQAADEYNLHIIGGTFDIEEDTMDNIKGGKLICTYDQYNEGIAKGVVKVIDKIQKGEKVDSITKTEGRLITG